MAKAIDKPDDGVLSQLPAPGGWKKTLLPKKSGTPRRNEIVFVSPTGEEIKSKRQLDQYLKSHPGGPSSSEFDWSTGETPRRSSRISEKSKATETPESGTPRKRQNLSSSKKLTGGPSSSEFDRSTGETPRRSSRRSEKSKATETPESETPRKRQNLSSSKKGPKDKRDDADEEGEAVEEKEDTLVGEETKTIEVEMKEADDLGDKSKEEVSTEDAAIHVSDKDREPKCEEKDVKKEEKDVKRDEIDIEKTEHHGTDNETTSNPKEAHTDINLLSIPSLDANEEGQKQTKEPEALQNEGLEDNDEGEKQLIEPEAQSKVGNKGLEDDKEGEEKQTEESAAPSKVENNKAEALHNEGLEDNEEGEKQLIEPEAPSKVGNKGLEDDEEGEEKQTEESAAPSKVENNKDEALQNEGLEDNEEGEKQLIEPEAPSNVGNKGLEDDEEGEKQTEESAAPSKVENNKADEITISDDSKKKAGSISQAASGPEDGGEAGAEKHSIGPEAPSSLPVHDEAVSTVKEVKTLNEALPEADAKVEKESDEVK